MLSCYLWRIPLNVMCKKSRWVLRLHSWNVIAAKAQAKEILSTVLIDKWIHTKPLHENPWKPWKNARDDGFSTASDTIPPKKSLFSLECWGESGCRIARCAIDVATSRDAGKSLVGGKFNTRILKSHGEMNHFILFGMIFSKLLLYSLTIFTSCSQHNFFFAKHFLVPSNDPTTTWSFGVKK